MVSLLLEKRALCFALTSTAWGALPVGWVAFQSPAEAHAQVDQATWHSGIFGKGDGVSSCLVMIYVFVTCCRAIKVSKHQEGTRGVLLLRAGLQFNVLQRPPSKQIRTGMAESLEREDTFFEYGKPDPKTWIKLVCRGACLSWSRSCFNLAG
jgi:hypothetical protein